MTTDELYARLQEQVDRLDLDLLLTGSSPEGKLDNLPFDSAATIEDIEIGLIESGARRTLARRLAADAMIDVTAWARTADQAGIERKRIADLCGITRKTLYDLLKAD